MRKFVLFLILSITVLFLLGASPLKTKYITIEGYVKTGKGVPVRIAHVKIDNGRDTYTDEEGYFRFEYIPAENYTISVTKEGYYSNTIKSEFYQDTKLNFKLRYILTILFYD